MDFKYQCLDPGNTCMNPLLCATKRGETRIVKMLLQLGYRVNEIKTKIEQTAVHLAACHGYNDILEILLSNGADLNVADMDGLAPLHYAVLLNNVPAVLILLNHGADPNIETIFNETPLTCAMKSNSEDVIKAFDEPASFPYPEFIIDDKDPARKKVHLNCMFHQDNRIPSGAKENTDDSSSEDEVSEDAMDDSSSEDEVSEDLDILTKTLLDFFLKEEHCDMTVIIGDRQIKAHRLVLGIRSPIFGIEINRKMKQKNIVHHADCDPDAFYKFALYLYSSKVEDISIDLVVKLYDIASKYEVCPLIRMCATYMINNISVDAFCDILLVAQTHGEIKLMQTLKDFFVTNMKSIVSSEKWQSFITKNITLANDLFIYVANQS